MTAPLSLYVAGDGLRDEATVQPLVSGILGHETTLSTFKPWSSVRLASGYARKLRFVLADAVFVGAQAVVATVDRDKSPNRSRLASLAEGRNEERANVGSSTAVLPCALGEADPHAEAWLLDDAEAVREVLRLDRTTAIPNVRKVGKPKDALEELCAGSARQGESRTGLLREIAARVLSKRCPHTNDTGFDRFAEEVRRELGPLVKGA